MQNVKPYNNPVCDLSNGGANKKKKNKLGLSCAKLRLKFAELSKH
jgi:hypothetical protein